MGNKNKWHWLLFIGLVMLLVSSILLTGCQSTLYENKIVRDAETVSYLKNMQSWQEKWDDEIVFGVGNIEERPYEALLRELVSIKPPEYSPLNLEHKQYISAHQLYFQAKRHLERLECEYEPEPQAREYGNPDCFDASSIYDLAKAIMFSIEAKYEVSYFFNIEQ